MGPINVPEPTADQITQLRSSALRTLEEKGVLSTLDPRDIKKFKGDDVYVGKFLKNHDNDMKLSHEMAVDTLQWRKTMGANDLTEKDADLTYLEKGVLCFYNQDKDGCKMLLFTVRHHNKGTADSNKLKKTLIYLLERFEREDGSKITVFFDMQDTGLKNMDMDFIQYMINVFKLYYPALLNYIIVFEMPWILSAMWKIIKGWLPPKALEIIKFLDKKSVSTLVAPDQCLVKWGGQSTFDHKFVPEIRNAPAAIQPAPKAQGATEQKLAHVSAAPMANGDIENKKVHFVEAASVAAQPIKMREAPQSGSSPSGVVKVDMDPMDELYFSMNRVGASASIYLTSRSSCPIAFKIKTTSPDKYRVKPALGVLNPDTQVEVTVTVCEQLPPAVMVRDKFLVMAIPIPKGANSHFDYNNSFKTVSKEDLLELRLKVGVSIEPDQSQTANQASPVPEALISKLDQIMMKQDSLEAQLVSGRRMVYLTLLLMIGLLFFLILTTNNLTTTIVSHSRVLTQATEMRGHLNGRGGDL